MGSLTGEALQLLSYFKPGTVPRCVVESSAPSSPALDLAVGLYHNVSMLVTLYFDDCTVVI